LTELSNHIDLEILQIPDMVKAHDIQLKPSVKTSKRLNIIPDQESDAGKYQQFKCSLEEYVL